MGEWERMDRNDSSNRNRGESAADRSESDQRLSRVETEVMAAYDLLNGSNAFVIAALDSDDAWIAATNGSEVDPTEWC